MSDIECTTARINCLPQKKGIFFVQAEGPLYAKTCSGSASSHLLGFA